MRNIFKEAKERYNLQILKIPEEEKQRREQSKYKNYLLRKIFWNKKIFTLPIDRLTELTRFCVLSWVQITKVFILQ